MAKERFAGGSLEARVTPANLIRTPDRRQVSRSDREGVGRM
jgi:hypothetical protein